MDRFNQFGLVDPGSDSPGDPDEDDRGMFGDIPAFEDFERSNVVDDCGSLDMADVDDLRKLILSPLERFKLRVGAIGHDIVGTGTIPLNMNGRNAACRMAENIENVKYFNPTAYVLGYIVTNGGDVIDPDIMTVVFNNLSTLQDDSVKPADVVRYSRYWVGTLGKFSV
jgi:hypothetical protein